MIWFLSVMLCVGRGLEKLRQHSWRERGLLLYAGVLTVVVRAGLSVFSLKQVAQSLCAAAMRLPRRRALTPTYRSQAAWAARTAGRWVLPDGPCLTQALVLQYLLLRRGEASTRLHIGVAKGSEGDLQAHAWVEKDGRVLVGGAGSPNSYEPFPEVGTKIDPCQRVASG